MNEIKSENWSHFTKITDYLDIGDVSKIMYAFRGHSDVNWMLKPTLLRYIGEEDITEDTALELEAKALNEFKSHAHLHLAPNEFSLTKDTISWWTVMQHHGAPTRLLNWTRSIYTAAYFAVTDHLDADGAIWVVHANTVHTKMREHYGDVTFPKTENEIQKNFLEAEAPPLLLFTDRLSKSERMITQQGFFSVSRNVLSDHGQIIERLFRKQSSKELFRKLVIPQGLNKIFLKKLRSMNITANSIFPGLDGLGRTVQEFIQLSASEAAL